MITVKLLGGLGNQLFQIAFGQALAHRGYDVYFDKTNLVPGTHREYSLGKFSIGIGLELCQRFVTGMAGQEISECGMPYSDDLAHPPDPSVLFGYYQTEKYFQDIQENVRKAFEIPELSTQVKCAGLYLAARTIAVHVRRGDYVNLQQFHGMPTVDYYRKAVQYISNRTGHNTVNVFSDDPEWCKQAFPDWQIVEDTTKHEDLYLMSKCEHIVIANSSFSWWGAWLNPNSDRIVVAPKRWFAEPSVDDRDIVPERWVRV